MAAVRFRTLNREACTPRYDLNLICAQFLRSEKSRATAGGEEPTKATHVVWTIDGSR